MSNRALWARSTSIRSRRAAVYEVIPPVRRYRGDEHDTQRMVAGHAGRRAVERLRRAGHRPADQGHEGHRGAAEELEDAARRGLQGPAAGRAPQAVRGRVEEAPVA